MAICMQCQRQLNYNDIGAYKKFVNKGAEQFLCRSCLARKFNVSEELIEEKIIQFKEQGCSLFV